MLSIVDNDFSYVRNIWGGKNFHPKTSSNRLDDLRVFNRLYVQTLPCSDFGRGCGSSDFRQSGNNWFRRYLLNLIIETVKVVRFLTRLHIGLLDNKLSDRQKHLPYVRNIWGRWCGCFLIVTIQNSTYVSRLTGAQSSLRNDVALF